jgi:catechol 2,3-dioxygenase-like lactoylglutathione lyase family enzyme
MRHVPQCPHRCTLFFNRYDGSSIVKNKIRLDGLTLTVRSVKRSADYYCEKLGFELVVDAAPHFALIRVGGPRGGTIGLLSLTKAKKGGVRKRSAKQRRAFHVELSTDNLDGLYKDLLAKRVRINTPPHDEPWERSMDVVDPDGYTLEFAQR